MVKEKEHDDKNYRVFHCIIKPNHAFYESFLYVTHLLEYIISVMLIVVLSNLHRIDFLMKRM